MDKLHAIETFMAIAEHGSMTEAASRLGRSLPAVVRTLANLEERIDVRLFNRTTRRIALTEEGRVYLAYCQRMSSELTSIENQLRGDREAPTGMVHMTAPVLFGQKHVVPTVTKLLRQHGQLGVRLLLLDRVVDLVHEHMDIAVRIGHLQDSTLMARQTGHIRQVLCASPKFLQQFGRPKSPTDIEGKPSIQLNGNSAGLTWSFRDNAKPISVAIAGTIICNMVEPMARACVEGIGYGLFFSYQVFEEVANGQLEVLLPEYEPKPLPVQLVYPHAHPLSSRVQTALEALETDLKDLLARPFGKIPSQCPI